MENKEVDLIAARIARIVDTLTVQIRSLSVEVKHHNLLIAKHLQALDDCNGDHENRLRALESTTTRLTTWMGIGSGGSSLLSLIALLRAFFGS